MIVEATGKVMQVLSKIEGVSAKTGKAWEKYTYLIEQSGMRPTSLVVSVFNYGLWQQETDYTSFTICFVKKAMR